jgi:hypothetical protein
MRLAGGIKTAAAILSAQQFLQEMGRRIVLQRGHPGNGNRFVSGMF